jgi:hypothetical protein
MEPRIELAFGWHPTGSSPVVAGRVTGGPSTYWLEDLRVRWQLQPEDLEQMDDRLSQVLAWLEPFS